MPGGDGRGVGRTTGPTAGPTAGPALGPTLGPALGLTVGVLTVDVAVLDEGAARLARATTGLREAVVGLDRVPVAAVATGSDAVLDALADLARQWTVLVHGAAGQAGDLAAALRAASAAYADAERAASDPVADLLDWIDLTPDEPTGREDRDGGPR